MVDSYYDEYQKWTGGISNIMNIVKAATNNMSIIDYIKPSIITGTILQDRTIEDNDILFYITNMYNTYYCAWLFTALRLNNVIANGVTVRDLLGVVRTNSLLLDEYEDIDDIINNEFLMNTKIKDIDNIYFHDDKESGMGIGSDTGDKVNIISHTQRKITLVINGNKVTIPMNIMLFQRLLAPSVFELYLNAKSRPTLMQRWTQLKVGQITWMEFIFDLDLVRKHKKALKEDDTNFIYETILKDDNKLAKTVLPLILGSYDTFNDKKNKEFDRVGDVGKYSSVNNITNMAIMDSKSFKKICKTLHCNFKNKSDRQKFLLTGRLLMLSVVDEMHEVVDVFYCGLDDYSSYSFSALNKQFGKTKDNKFSLKDVMSAFASGAGPRF